MGNWSQKRLGQAGGAGFSGMRQRNGMQPSLSTRLPGAPNVDGVRYAVYLVTTEM